MNWSLLLEKLEAIELSSTSIIVAVIALLVVSTLLGREFSTWLTSTNKIRRELNDIRDQLDRIEAKLASSAVEKSTLVAEKAAESPFYFPIDAEAPTDSVEGKL